MSERGPWQEIRRLGGGGQSEVFLVRSPARVAERRKCLEKVMELAGQGFNENRAKQFCEATASYSRSEQLSELGALKKFAPRTAAGPQATQHATARLQSEISVLGQQRRGLLRLLDSNESERWIVTEYCPRGTLADNPFLYRGDAGAALVNFRFLVETVAGLHKDGVFHRDIKPANGQLLSDIVPRPCRVCGKGFYRPSGDSWGVPKQIVSLPLGTVTLPGQGTASWRHDGALYLRPAACDSCKHVEFFREP